MPTQDTIIATELPEWQRLAFLPKYFGHHFMRGERLVFDWLWRLAPTDYKGGLWLFFELSNGGFYLAPAAQEPLALVVESSGYRGVLSPDAAGIVAVTFALSQLASTLLSAAASATLVEHRHRLLDYAEQHREASLIFAAID